MTQQRTMTFGLLFWLVLVGTADGAASNSAGAGPGDSLGVIDMGLIDRELERYRHDAAIQRLEQWRAAAELDSATYEMLTVKLAEVYEESRQYARSARVLMDLLARRERIDDRAAMLTLRLAETMRRARAYDDAIALLEQALAAALVSALPADLELEWRRVLAELYLQTGRLEQAKQLLMELLAAFPDQRGRLAGELLVELYALGAVAPAELDAMLEQFGPEAFTPAFASALLSGLAEREDQARALHWIVRLGEVNPAAQLSLVSLIHAVAKALRIESDVEQRLAAAAVRPEASDETVLVYANYLALDGNFEGALGVARTRGGAAFLDLQARVLMRQQRYTEALPVLEELCRVDVDAAPRYEEYGVALAEMGRQQEAIAAWRRIPELANVGATDGWLRVLTLCRRYNYAEAAREAEQRLQHARRIWQTNPSLLARSFMEEGRYDAAVGVYLDTCRELGGPDAGLRTSWLKTIERLHAEAEAEAAVAAALNKAGAGPEQDWLLSLRVELLVMLHRYAQAVEVASQARPAERAAILYELGCGLSETGMDAEAAEAFRRVDADRHPYSGLAALQLSQLEWQLGRLDEAVAQSERALALLPRDDAERLACAQRLAEIHIERGQPAAALAVLAELPMPGTGEADWPRRMVLGAEAQLQLGAVRSASEELARVVQLARQPDWRSRARLRAADVLLWEGRADAARAAYADVIVADPGAPYAQQALERMLMMALLSPAGAAEYARATQYAWQGRIDDAVAAYRELAAILRDQPDGAAMALLAIARLLQRRGDVEAARQECERAAELAKDDRLEAEIKWLSLALQPPRSVSAETALLERFVIDYPATIQADRARVRLRALRQSESPAAF